MDLCCIYVCKYVYGWVFQTRIIKCDRVKIQVACHHANIVANIFFKQT